MNVSSVIIFTDIYHTILVLALSMAVFGQSLALRVTLQIVCPASLPEVTNYIREVLVIRKNGCCYIGEWFYLHIKPNCVGYSLHSNKQYWAPRKVTLRHFMSPNSSTRRQEKQYSHQIKENTNETLIKETIFCP
jgi:hypothetical protein